MPVLLIIAVIALVGVGIYLGWLWEKKRREALAKMAAALGLTYSPDDPVYLPGRLGHIHTFSRGHSQRAKNVVHGAYRGRDVIAFITSGLRL